VSALSGVRYQVLFTPKASINSYGTQVDVTDRIRLDGLQKVKRTIDSGDYGFGVYTYDDINLKGFNKDGIFNTQEDTRSMFPAGRDGCKVTIVFKQYDNEDNETDTIVFNGLINEEATRLDVVKDIITFKVLSLTSIIRNTKVPAGLISSGTLASAAMLSILSTNRIEQILGVDALNINPGIDYAIDVGTAFDNKPAKSALDELLLSTNSVMTIDSSLNVIIRSRVENLTRPILYLYGKSDGLGRENIINISNYNSGFHRMFTSVLVNDTEASNSGLSQDYGVRQSIFQLEFITAPETEATIAQTLLDEFKAPKIELEVQVPIRTALGFDLLDRVSINYPLRAKPPAGTFLPVYDVAKYDDDLTPYPLTYGSLYLAPRLSFKIIEIVEDPKSFTATLKIRQVGSDVFDGVFDVPGNSLYDFAVYGDSVYIENTDLSVLWNPSVYGAGLYEYTEYE